MVEETNIAILPMENFETLEECLPIVEDVCQDVDVHIRFANEGAIVPSSSFASMSDMTICRNVIESKIRPSQVGGSNGDWLVRLVWLGRSPQHRPGCCAVLR